MVHIIQPLADEPADRTLLFSRPGVPGPRGRGCRSARWASSSVRWKTASSRLEKESCSRRLGFSRRRSRKSLFPGENHVRLQIAFRHDYRRNGKPGRDCWKATKARSDQELMVLILLRKLASLGRYGGKPLATRSHFAEEGADDHVEFGQFGAFGPLGRSWLMMMVTRSTEMGRKPNWARNSRNM